MFCMGQSGLSGSGQTIYRCNEFGSVSQCVLFLAAVAGCITVSVCKRPCHSQCAFLMLTEISHTKNCSTVLVCIKIAQCQRITQAAVVYVRCVMRRPLRIGENVNVRLFAVADGFGVLVHLYIFVRHILEVQHPVVKNIFFTFRNEEMCLCHKLRIQTDKALCMIQCFPTCLINSVHYHFVKFCFIHTRLTFDTACCCITACNSAIVE